MPSEINHIDELIQEYDGRETELLDTLTSMREGDGSDDDDDEEEDDEDLSIPSGRKSKSGVPLTLPLPLVKSNEDEVSLLTESKAFKDSPKETKKNKGGPKISASARIGALGAELPEPDDDAPVREISVHSFDETDEKKKRRRDLDTLDQEEKDANRKRRCLFIIICLICLLFVILAVVLGILFGRPSNDDPTTGIQEQDYSDRDVPQKGQTNNNKPNKSKNNDGYDKNAEPSSCNTITPDMITQLGVKNLQGNYPKVDIDGTSAIVSTGSGYIAFFTLNQDTMIWTQNEVFEVPSAAGDVSSVAISGNTAVVGAPDASTDLNIVLGTELETGAIYIYEKQEVDGTWRQLPGAYIPEEYKITNFDQYVEADFGYSVAIENDIIVASAPEERNRQGSITVFHKEKDNWKQVGKKANPAGLCGTEYFGYSVAIYKDMIAASADCDVNIVLYQVKRFNNGSVSLSLSQQLQMVAASWGAVSSISMSWDTLVYSTVLGGLFYYNRQDLDTGSRYFRSQEMSFTIQKDWGLYEYPLSMDANMLALSVKNNVLIYTQDKFSKEWRRETISLANSGDYVGYNGASLSISDGVLLVAGDREVNSYDFLGCVRESSAPTPSPSFSPTELPTSPTNEPTCIYVNMEFDKYPQDTSWDITQAGDDFAVAESPAFDDQLRDYLSEVCLPPGNFVFTVYDVYSDGMCCDWGQGSYNVTDAEGYLIAKGGEFGESESTQFSMPFDPRNPGFIEDQEEEPSPEDSQPAPQPTPPVPTPPVSVPPPDDYDDCYTLEINISLDQYPADTRWEIIPQGQSRQVLVASPEYDASQALTNVTQSECLVEGTYDFIIYDVYSDGICCNWGEGSYQLAFGDDIVASGGSFGADETKTFVTPGIATSEPTPGIATLPNNK